MTIQKNVAYTCFNRQERTHLGKRSILKCQHWAGILANTGPQRRKLPQVSNNVIICRYCAVILSV